MALNLDKATTWLARAGAGHLIEPKVPERQWLYGDEKLPRGTYRQVVIIMADRDNSGALDGDLSQLPAQLEERARKAGFRLVQVTPLTKFPLVPGLEGVQSAFFSGYAASNSEAWIDWALSGTVRTLGKAIKSAAIVMSAQDVSPAEKTSLDTRWALASADAETRHEDTPIKTKLTRNLDVWPFLGGLALFGAVIVGIWALPNGDDK